jgi:transient receptor potential cation channel subfamily C protein 4
MRNLVRRYVTVDQRKTENEGVTEDDVNEIKQDISAFRCELINILQKSGMATEHTSGTGTGKRRFFPCTHRTSIATFFSL